MEMYVDNRDYIYTFAFSVLDNKYSINVYSFNKADIILFMNQHGFNNASEYIQTVPYDSNEGRYEDKMLKLFMFKSNTNNENYSVMTSEFIFEKCVTNAGSLVTKSCWLSSLLPEYQTLPLFKYINEMIEQLKYATVMDFQLFIDDSTCIELNPDVNNNIIIDDLLNNTYLTSIGEGYTSEEVRDITIESYINGFATLS